MIDENSTLEDICYEVAAALQRVDVAAVLTGGSAATIYAHGAYTSLDADFVFSRRPHKRAVETALEQIGYKKAPSSGMFEHPLTKYTVDFPKGPLAVGGDYVRVTNTLERNGQFIQILTPTDCVRDRLAHFFFWDDYTALAAAVAIMQSSYREHVDVEAVREWTQRERRKNGVDHTPKLTEFLSRSNVQGR